MTLFAVPEPATPPTGHEIEVQTFDGRWASGFEVVAVAHNGYLLRRRSDGTVLPVPIDPADIRAR